ncbi:MAG TPA: DUF2255 family protein [Streptosporangiaceae bacterium]|jgi:hypothetical protein
MTAAWTPEQLERIGAAEELRIASRRPDGSLRRWVPIWVVAAGGQVYVRTWHRRTTGWFGQVLTEPRARVQVPGLEADVVVEDVGAGPGELRSSVDEAYRGKYARYGHSTIGQMVNDSAAAATLRLMPS